MGIPKIRVTPELIECIDFLPSLCKDHCYSKPTSDVMKEYFTEIQSREDHGEVNTEYKMNDCTAKPSTHSRLNETPLSVLGELPYPVKVVVHTTHTIANKLLPGNTLYLTVFNHLLAMLLAYQMSRENLHTTLKYNVQFQNISSSSHMQHNDGLYLRLSCHQHSQDATCSLSIHTLKAYTARIQQACFPPPKH